MTLGEASMRYEFEDIKISREKRYSLGKETTTNKYYLSFPVSPPNHRYVEYEEYYKISSEQLSDFLETEDSLIEFLEKCRRRKMDHLFLFYPIAPIRGYST